MKGRSALDAYEKSGVWWETSISDIKKNSIRMRGYPIEELIGNVSYAQMLYLLLCGELLDARKAFLLECVLVAGADHGPRAPSIAAARMAATCGISFNSAVATGINVLGDSHGGAAEKAMNLFYTVHRDASKHPDAPLFAIVEKHFDLLQHAGEKLSGYGHQLHDDDPRVKKLFVVAEQLVDEGVIDGWYLEISKLFLQVLEQRKGKKMTMNIDGVSAAIQCELEIPAESAKGVFALSRGMGVVAHAYEELKNGVLVKGPCPNSEDLVKYSGAALRHL